MSMSNLEPKRRINWLGLHSPQPVILAQVAGMTAAECEAFLEKHNKRALFTAVGEGRVAVLVHVRVPHGATAREGMGLPIPAAISGRLEVAFVVELV